MARARAAAEAEAFDYAMRADEPRPCLPHDEALSNAPKTDGVFFKVPKVIERSHEPGNADSGIGAHRDCREAVHGSALVEAYYEKIEAEDAEIGAYLTLCKERALRQAARIDELADKARRLAAAGRGADRN